MVVCATTSVVSAALGITTVRAAPMAILSSKPRTALKTESRSRRASPCTTPRPSATSGAISGATSMPPTTTDGLFSSRPSVAIAVASAIITWKSTVHRADVRTKR